jgi:hypothetical protein
VTWTLAGTCSFLDELGDEFSGNAAFDGHSEVAAVGTTSSDSCHTGQVRLAWVVMVVGCGRVDFDPRPDPSDAAVPDARPPMVVYMTNSLATGVDLCTLDVLTGQVTVLGTLAPTVGDLGGLAWWAPNELYGGNRTGDFVDITLAPLGGVIVANEGGHIGGLEAWNTELLGIDQTAHDVIQFTPPSGTFLHTPLTSGGSPLVSNGGDLVQMSNGDWLLWPNVNGQLFLLDPASGIATPRGPVIAGVPSISGLVRDDQDHLYAIMASTDQVVDMDPATGALGAARTMCVACPTPYDFMSGDLTRSP